jgi:hypothetical protein
MNLGLGGIQEAAQPLDDVSGLPQIDVEEVFRQGGSPLSVHGVPERLRVGVDFSEASNARTRVGETPARFRGAEGGPPAAGTRREPLGLRARSGRHPLGLRHRILRE